MAQTLIDISKIKDYDSKRAIDELAEIVEDAAVTGLLGAGVADFLATPTSANLLTAVTNETGTGVLVFGTAPTVTSAALTTPHLSTPFRTQGAPTAKTVSATLTAAEIAAGIITVNQAAGAVSTQTMPTGAALDTLFVTTHGMATGEMFEFSVINLSTVDDEDAAIAGNGDVTLVGSGDVPAYSAAGSLNSSGRFGLRRTGTATYSLYRLA